MRLEKGFKAVAEQGRRFGNDQVSDGAFFTKPVSALLLADLAGKLDTDWADLSAVAEMNIVDCACGSGNLLVAMVRIGKRRHVDAGGQDANECARIMVRDVLAGHDIDEPALRDAFDLLSAQYDGPLVMPNLYCWPHGEMPDGSVRCGVLEVLARDRAKQDSLFGPEVVYPPVRITSGNSTVAQP